VLQKPTKTEELSTKQSIANTKQPSALFSADEIQGIENIAIRLQDKNELIKFAHERSLVWLVMLDKLSIKAALSGRGPSQITQLAAVLEKLIKWTADILEVPRDDKPLQKTSSGKNSVAKNSKRQESSSGNAEALLEEARELFTS
jgi:hypothetical protein